MLGYFGGEAVVSISLD